LSINDIEKIISTVKNINKNIICFIDNCFGEFTEDKEPTEVGGDLTCGSLIKNLGGGIVPAGGYIAGKKDLVQLAAERLTAPGIGVKGGCMFDITRLMFQGLFYAPHIITQTLKGVSLVSYCFEQAGYEVNPKSTEKKTDIVVAIKLKDKNLLEKICKIVQSNSPVNSHLTPIPCKLPGYEDEVIMAGGTFIEGSTVELSCDGPMRDPYILYWQGGINYLHTKLVLSKIFS
jgi:cystathionine gamma-lyase